MGGITLTGRWREKLVAAGEEGILVFEFPGHKKVYFPNQERWLTHVPAWAKDKQAEYLAACELWCKENRIPITVVDDTHVSTENLKKVF